MGSLGTSLASMGRRRSTGYGRSRQGLSNCIEGEESECGERGMMVYTFEECKYIFGMLRPLLRVYYHDGEGEKSDES